MEAKLSKVTKENSKLSALIKGANPIEVTKQDDATWSPSSSLKDQFIKDYAKEQYIRIYCYSSLGQRSQNF